MIEGITGRCAASAFDSQACSKHTFRTAADELVLDPAAESLIARRTDFVVEDLQGRQTNPTRVAANAPPRLLDWRSKCTAGRYARWSSPHINGIAGWDMRNAR